MGKQANSQACVPAPPLSQSLLFSVSMGGSHSPSPPGLSVCCAAQVPNWEVPQPFSHAGHRAPRSRTGPQCRGRDSKRGPQAPPTSCACTCGSSPRPCVASLAV